MMSPSKGSVVLHLALGCVWCMLLLGPQMTWGQEPYRDRLYQFLSFDAIPTWTGVVTDWDKAQPRIHLYDSERYKGHAQYVSVALGTGITFATFKSQVRDPGNRKYMPFFLFDLRRQPVVIDGKAHTWALRIEDYAYTDTYTEITLATLRLLDLVRQHVDAVTGGESHGIIVLSGNPKSLPYKNSAADLGKAGYPYRSIQQLVELGGGKRVQVVNPGVGYGYLRYYKQEIVPFDGPYVDEAPTPSSAAPNIYLPELGMRDIVIFPETPARIPPVAGIITLDPQTPLSHVNLLALNRGTFNVYAMDTGAVPGLSKHLDQLVRVEAREGKVVVRPSTLAEAERYWEQHRRRVVIPAPDTLLREAVVFGNWKGKPLTAQQVGAKAANYALLEGHFPKYTREGMAIPFWPYLYVVRSTGADTLIARLAGESLLTEDKLASRLHAIQDRIRKGELPPGYLKRLYSDIRAGMGEQNLRLRSSTNCEDLPDFNGAGLYLSVGFKKDEDAARLQTLLLEVYASLWTKHAWQERAYFGIDHRQAAMAVLVNPSFKNEAANGVVLTVPKGDGSFSIVINSQQGENLVTNPGPSLVPEVISYASAGAKDYRVELRSSLQDLFLKPEWVSLAGELRDLAGQVHVLFQAGAPKGGERVYGVDIEFKVLLDGGGKPVLFLKQARLLGQVLPE